MYPLEGWVKVSILYSVTTSSNSFEALNLWEYTGSPPLHNPLQHDTWYHAYLSSPIKGVPTYTQRASISQHGSWQWCYNEDPFSSLEFNSRVSCICKALYKLQSTFWHRISPDPHHIPLRGGRDNTLRFADEDVRPNIFCEQKGQWGSSALWPSIPCHTFTPVLSTVSSF